MKIFRVYNRETSNLIEEITCQRLSSGLHESPVGKIVQSYFQIDFDGKKIDAFLHDVFEVLSNNEEVRQIPLHEKIIL